MKSKIFSISPSICFVQFNENPQILVVADLAEVVWSSRLLFWYFLCVHFRDICFLISYHLLLPIINICSTVFSIYIASHGTLEKAYNNVYPTDNTCGYVTGCWYEIGRGRSGLGLLEWRIRCVIPLTRREKRRIVHSDSPHRNDTGYNCEYTRKDSATNGRRLAINLNLMSGRHRGDHRKEEKAMGFDCVE